MERCPGCGLEAIGGTAGCQSLFHELIAREMSDYHYSRYHRLVVDAYCAQHPEQYCLSAKSLMAHLGGLCCAFEHEADPEAYHALQQSLNGTPTLEKPKLPNSRGDITLGQLRRAADPASYGREAEKWARSVWEAYSNLHPFVRRWMYRALADHQRTARVKERRA